MADESVVSHPARLLAALFGVALTSSAEESSRVEQLGDLAQAAAEAGLADVSDTATRQAGQLLATAAAEATAADVDADHIAWSAHELGRIAEGLGQQPAARAAYEVALALYRRAGETDSVGVTLHDIADTWREQGDMQRALTHYRDAARSKSGSGSLPSLLLTLAALAEAELEAGTPAGVREAVDAGVRRSTAAAQANHSDPDRKLIATCAFRLGRAAQGAGSHGPARAAYLLAASMLDDGSSSRVLATVLHGVGSTWEAEGDLATALARYREAAALGGPHDDLAAWVATMTAVARVEADAGACEATLREALHAVQQADGDPGTDPRAIHGPAFSLGRAAAGLHTPALAREAFIISERILRDLGELGLLSIVLREIAASWKAEGHPERSLELYRAARDVAAAARTEWAAHVTALLDVAEAEAGDGTLEASDAALGEAVRLVCSGIADGRSGRQAMIQTAVNAGRCAERLKRPALARQAYLAAAPLFEQEGDQAGLGVLTHDLGDTWSADGDVENALRNYREAAALKAESDPLSRLLTYSALAEAEATAGTPSAAEAALAHGVEAATEAAQAPDVDPSVVASRAFRLGSLAERLGRTGPARAAYLVATPLLERNGDDRALGVVLHCIADTWKADGDLPNALANYREAARRKARTGEWASHVATLRALADAEARAGDHAAAEAAISEAMRVVTDAAAAPGSDPVPVAIRAFEIGGSAVALARPGMARSAYQVAAPLFQRAGDTRAFGVALHEIGDTWHAEGRGPEALAAYRDAAVQLAASDDWDSKIHNLTRLAEVEAQVGTVRGAEDALMTALDVLSAVAADSEPNREAAVARAAELARLAKVLELAPVVRRAEALAAPETPRQPGGAAT